MQEAIIALPRSTHRGVSSIQPLRSVLILAGDSDGNLGDKAIVRATCDELHRLNPGVKICIRSDLPEPYIRQYFRASPISRGPRGFFKVLRAAGRADLVLVGGGGLFQEDDSLIKMPYWCALVVAVRSRMRNIAAYALGAGPLTSQLGRRSARLALACMNSVSVRDQGGQATLAPLTRHKVEVIPDPAVLLRLPPDHRLPDELERISRPNGKPLIAVALREWFHQERTFIPHKYAVRYKLRRIKGSAERATFYRLMAEALDQIIDRTEARLLFLPSYNVGHEADYKCCERVMSQMRNDTSRLFLLENPIDYLKLGERLDLILSARLHPIILCTTVGVPAVGLGYNPKFLGYFRKLDMESHLMPLDDMLDATARDRLVDRVLGVLDSSGDRQNLVEQEQERLRKYNEQLFRLRLPGGDLYSRTARTDPTC